MSSDHSTFFQMAICGHTVTVYPKASALHHDEHTVQYLPNKCLRCPAKGTRTSFQHAFSNSGHTMISLVEQEVFTLPEHLSSPTVFSGVRVTRSLVLCVYFADRCLYLWLQCCLFFFDLRILITPLVSSSSSLLTVYNQDFHLSHVPHISQFIPNII